MRKLIIVLILASLSTLIYAQPPNPFTQDQGSGRWRGRIDYRDAGGISRNYLYELILIPDGTCIVTISGKQNGEDVFQDADGSWSFNEPFFYLECDFPEPVFDHLPALNWRGFCRFDANRFTLMLKLYPDAPKDETVAFTKVDD
ncbi:hypothetical protein AGMMS49991_06340 [Spirochaetia bacterium]|nr:hypothetical protein AGMMS49991_06340 [Spirochaetia bacterium]